MNTKKILALGTISVVLICAVIFLSIITANDEQSNATQTPQPTEIPVNVTIVEKQATQIWKNFSARLEAVDFVELRPQVSGTIMKVNYEDGQYVERGDVVLVIDPSPYQAEVNQAKADLKTARTDSEFAQQQYVRAANLIETNAISKRIYDERKSAADMAEAEILSAQAKLKRANIDLDRAYVKAPISGRLGRIEITKGNLVESGANAPILTSIVSEDYIYADFEVDEQTYLQYIRRNAKNKEAEAKVPVRLQLNQDHMVYEGTIYTFDNRIDVTSGTIRARALFENSDRALLPGMFAQVEMGGAIEASRIFVDERAIGTDQDRRFVFIVDQENTVEYRELKLGVSSRGKREVLAGLDEGDKVIVDGIMFMRVGMKVKPMIIDEPLSSYYNTAKKLSS